MSTSSSSNNQQPNPQLLNPQQQPRPHHPPQQQQTSQQSQSQPPQQQTSSQQQQPPQQQTSSQQQQPPQQQTSPQQQQQQQLSPQQQTSPQQQQQQQPPQQQTSSQQQQPPQQQSSSQQPTPSQEPRFQPPCCTSSTQKQPKNDDKEGRRKFIIDTFLENFSDSMRENPKGWRGRFRKMAADEFAFYRGSAVLFYRDLKNTLSEDPWLKRNPKAATIFLHGDLHAENFGTYIDRFGIINFDVNDFDEGYIGPFTWDVKRLVASLNLITFAKAFCDEKIKKIITCTLRAYLAQIYEYCDASDKPHTPLTSDNTEGSVNILLKESRLGSKETSLEIMTYIENYERKFKRTNIVKDVSDELRHQILLAFQEYVQTIPDYKKEVSWAYKVKDIVSRTSPGIGSAGTTSYNLLIQGRTQALETDDIIYMKVATQSAVATAIKDPELEKYFKHDGLRTVLCAYAMHACTSKWLGYATINNQPMFVDVLATHSKDLDWEDIDEFEDVCQTAEYLGKAMAKIHCIADVDSIDREKHGRQHSELIPFDIIPRHAELTIRDALGGQDDEFIEQMVSFAMEYGDTVRGDHQLFFDTFRTEQIPILNEYAANPEQHKTPTIPQKQQ